MHDLVRELSLRVYKNICNISEIRNLLHSTQEVGHFISYCVPANNVIHHTDAVHELSLQVYKTICNNISKIRNLVHSTQGVGHFISYCVPANNVIHRTDAVHV